MDFENCLQPVDSFKLQIVPLVAEDLFDVLYICQNDSQTEMEEYWLMIWFLIILVMEQSAENKLTRYTLAYDFVPQLMVSILNNENIGIAPMADKEFFMKVADKMNMSIEGFSWNEFDITVEHLDEKHLAIVYKFPEPQNQPEALYGAIVIDHEKSEVSYFTLEKGRTEGRWALGRHSLDKRGLIGLFDITPSKDKFFELIMKNVNLSH